MWVMILGEAARDYGLTRKMIFLGSIPRVHREEFPEVGRMAQGFHGGPMVRWLQHEALAVAKRIIDTAK